MVRVENVESVVTNAEQLNTNSQIVNQVNAVNAAKNVVEEALSPRDQIRNDLIAFAKEHINNWDSYADREFSSIDLGFEFVSRQTTFESNTLTVSKASVPGLTLAHHAYYRENILT